MRVRESRCSESYTILEAANTKLPIFCIFSFSSNRIRHRRCLQTFIAWLWVSWKSGLVEAMLSCGSKWFYISNFNICDLRCGSVAARLLRLWVRVPPEAWMYFCCEWCVCCQVEVSATSWSFVQRSPTEYDAVLCVI